MLDPQKTPVRVRHRSTPFSHPIEKSKSKRRKEEVIEEQEHEDEGASKMDVEDSNNDPLALQTLHVLDRNNVSFRWKIQSGPAQIQKRKQSLRRGKKKNALKHFRSKDGIKHQEMNQISFKHQYQPLIHV